MIKCNKGEVYFSGNLLTILAEYSNCTNKLREMLLEDFEPEKANCVMTQSFMLGMTHEDNEEGETND